MKNLFAIVLLLCGLSGLAYAHTNTTVISKSNLSHPDLGYDGGAGLHAAMYTMYELLGDNAGSRFQQYTAVADSTLSSYVHNFGVAFTELRVYIYTGSGAALVRVADPSGSGWVIAANGVAPTTTVDVTTPASAGPHTFAVVISHGDISLDDDVTGVLAVAQGGTNSTTASSAAAALGVGSAAAAEFGSVRLSGLTGAGFFELRDQSSEPSSPAGTDDLKVFVEDKIVYTKDSNGVVVPLGSGSGAGEVNYILNPDASVDLTGWSASGAGITVARTTTAAELPREPLTASAIKITPVSGTTDYASYCFQIGDSDKNKALKIQAAKLVESGYATGDLVVEMYSNVSADCAGAYTQENIMGYDDDIADINASNDVMFFTWLSTDSDWYELRVRRTAGTNFISLSNVVVGPGQVVKAPNPRWPSYTGALSGSDVTISGGAATVEYAKLVPFQDANGGWWLNFVINVTHASATALSFLINDTYVDTEQSIAATADSDSRVLTGWVEQSTNDLLVRTKIITGAAATVLNTTGTIALASKPTWADKAAPDIFLAGLPDQAALDGNWQDFTPTPSASFTGTFSEAQIRRDGQDLLGKVVYTCDGNETGFMYITPPNGLTVDETALTQYGVIGKASIYKNGSSARIGLIYWDSANNRMYLGAVEVSGTYATQAAADMDSTAVPFDALSGDVIYFDFRVPISGWSWFDYIYQYIVGFNTATSDSPGLVKKGISQIKYLSADNASTNEDLSDLDFTLTVGRTYMITSHIKTDLTGTDLQVLFVWKDDTTIINRQDASHANGISDSQIITTSSTIIHTMASTDLNFSVASSTIGSLLGNGSYVETWVQVTDVTSLIEIGTVE